MMKKIKNQIVTGMLSLPLVLTGCGIMSKNESDAMKKVVNAPQVQTGTSTIPADQPAVAGVPGASVPVGQGVIARIENALEGNARSNAGNFQTAIGQFGANLALTQNPRRATGAGDVPMIAYAACSDVPLTTYGIANNATVAQARNALIAAGVRILDTCMGGLASTGPMAAQVNAEFTRLVDMNAAIQGQTTRISFNSMCIAATTFCVQYRGF